MYSKSFKFGFFFFKFYHDIFFLKKTIVNPCSTHARMSAGGNLPDELKTQLQSSNEAW